jgi:hypothetical protein
MPKNLKITVVGGAFLAAVSALSLPAVAAMTDAQCAATWKQADRNGDGAVTQDEAPAYFSAARAAGKTVADRMTSADFASLCKTGAFDMKSTDAGVLQKGANSFTEAQAKARAAAHGFTNISSLSKDQDGIWRGSAQQGGKSVEIAIDFKGNVVVDQ